MDLSKLPIAPPRRSRATDPADIFDSLTLRGPVENIWGPQGEALRQWHERRAETDVVIEMNTGGGKTLVGLLIAQSLVNETNGKVLYVCPTKQLIEQAAQQAAGCGIPVATYMETRWTDQHLYDGCVRPCITNYAALFNGLTVFRDHDLRAVVLDDAHVSQDVVRGQYTIWIPRDFAAFRPICNLFRASFSRNSQIQQFEDALEGNWRSLLFVPMFAVREKWDVLRRLLLDNGVSRDRGTKFAWEHLKDRLSRCAVLISGSGIEITPPMLPVQDSACFRPGVRRVYMTATMPGRTELVRTFGVGDFSVISPGGKSGQAQRQFLFLAGEDDMAQRSLALKLIEARKACVIAPSGRAADKWCPPAAKYDGAQGHEGIREFAQASEPRKLALAARYDGIDLPGDACRILVLDGLPCGETLFDRFLEQVLHITNLRAARTATRVVQAVGRIFRSNTDHGAVILCRQDLQSWLHDPNHLQYMPSLLQQQVQFGIELRRMFDTGRVSFESLLNAVLTGAQGWDTLYTQHVGAFETAAPTERSTWYADLVVRERKAFSLLWDGNFSPAAGAYSSLSESACDHDANLAAWYSHWGALASELAGDAAAAARAYLRAAADRSELGRPKVDAGIITAAEVTRASTQATNVASQMAAHPGRWPVRVQAIIDALTYEADTNPVEQALAELGAFLGLHASRPDREEGTGPDVLWRHPSDGSGAALEAKTNKQPSSQYKKRDDIGQFHDHVRWLEETYPTERFYKYLVGKRLRVSADAHPPEDLRVISLEQFGDMARTLLALHEYVESTTSGSDMELCVERGMQMLGLTWPRCLDSRESVLALDLKREQPSGSGGQ